METQLQESPRTVAWLIERYITEMNARPNAAPMGLSHFYTLRMLKEAPIGSVIAAALTKHHVIDHCKERIKKVIPATINHDVGYLSGVLKYAPSAWDDCEDVTHTAVELAKPFLVKNGFIGKSTPRDRRPSLEELERLLEFFSLPPKKANKKRIDMVRMTLWQWYSAMRVGNSCEILWADWNREEQTILVRKMKDPKRHNKAKVVALTKQAQQFLIALEEVRDPDEPRIHPYRKQSVGAAYTNAKKVLGIVNLRLHDSRRDRGTRLVEDDGCTSAQAICYTGHETVAVYERTYLRQDPAKIVRQVNALTA